MTRDTVKKIARRLLPDEVEAEGPPFKLRARWKRRKTGLERMEGTA
jgi:hypothetical protein